MHTPFTEKCIRDTSGSGRSILNKDIKTYLFQTASGLNSKNTVSLLSYTQLK